ncbi:hypothetical protein TPB0596_45520 [Tsukamurella pulmonis]|nr:hypothetical protein TPB0596_45520 [Tsukamurella pulmonis]
MAVTFQFSIWPPTTNMGFALVQVAVTEAGFGLGAGAGAATAGPMAHVAVAASATATPVARAEIVEVFIGWVLPQWLMQRSEYAASRAGRRRTRGG